MGGKKFDWRNYIELGSGLSEKDRKIITAVLDHECADKNGDGRPDDPNARKVFDDLKKYGHGKILIAPSPQKMNYSTATNTIGFDLEDIRTLGFANEKTRVVEPQSVNSELFHEIGHAIRYHKALAFALDREVNKAFSEETALKKEQHKFKKDSEEYYAIGSKLKEVRSEIKILIKKYGMDEEPAAERYKTEQVAMKVESAIGYKYGESKRTNYGLTAHLNEPPAEAIYFTDNSQKLSDKYKPKKVQIFSGSDALDTKLAIFGDDNIDARSKALLYLDIQKFEDSFDQQKLKADSLKKASNHDVDTKRAGHFTPSTHSSIKTGVKHLD